MTRRGWCLVSHCRQDCGFSKFLSVAVDPDQFININSRGILTYQTQVNGLTGTIREGRSVRTVSQKETSTS